MLPAWERKLRRAPLRGSYHTAMRALSGAPPRVGGETEGGAGSGVPPQLTTSSAVRHSDAGVREGRRGIAKVAPLMRLAPTACAPS